MLCGDFSVEMASDLCDFGCAFCIGKVSFPIPNPRSNFSAGFFGTSITTHRILSSRKDIGEIFCPSLRQVRRTTFGIEKVLASTGFC